MNGSSETKAHRYPPSRHWLEVVRPNFFPGQSLSDQDLTAVITWAEQRLRLETACDDWGIVCGLHVSIGPGEKPHVLISPGYGFNAVRELCVVSGSGCDCGAPSPCKCTDQRAFVWCLPTPNGPSCNDGGNETEVTVGRSQAKPKELAIFDLSLSPCEVERQHALSLATDGRRHCQPSRFRASAAVSYECVAYKDAIQESVVADGSSTAIKFLDSFHDVPQPNGATPFAATEVAMLRDILAGHAKKYSDLFCIKPPKLDGEIGKDLTEAKLTEILSWLVFSLRRAQCCATMPESERIPLCRIWAKKAGKKYEVLWIDEGAPHRRWLRCQPRAFRIAEWIGEPFELAELAAKSAQVTLAKKLITFGSPAATIESLATTRVALKNWLEAETKVAAEPSALLTAYCIDASPKSRPIVVGFA